MVFVVDASVIVALQVEDPLSVAASEVVAQVGDAGDDLAAPDLIEYEVANALWKRNRRDELAADAALNALSDLLLVRLQLYPGAELAPAALALAMAHDLTAYDASYLALCANFGGTLLTGDAGLAATAGSAGFAVRAIEPG